MANKTGNSVFLYENTGGAAAAIDFIFNSGFDINAPFLVQGSDIEDNKDIDLIVAPTGGNTTILRNLGRGNGFAQPASLPLGGPVMDLNQWDMNNDGTTDFAVIVDDEEVGPVVRLLQNESASGPGFIFSLLEDVAVGEDPALVIGADVTSSRFHDLITVNLAAALAGGSTTIAMRSTGLDRPTTPGDLNGDNVVDVLDLLILLGAWGNCPKAAPCPADLNNSGTVDVQDLLILLSNWG